MAVLLIALGSVLAFAAGRLATSAFAAVLGVLWVASLLVVVVFTKTDWTVGPSVGGVIHRYASAVGFVSLPVAVIMMAGRVFPDRPAWRWSARGFAAMSLAWFGVIVVGVVRMAAGHGPWWLFAPLGLVERMIALTAVAALLTLALGMARKPRDVVASRDLLSAA